MVPQKASLIALGGKGRYVGGKNTGDHREDKSSGDGEINPEQNGRHKHRNALQHFQTIILNVLFYAARIGERLVL
ncbi:hypothetical protein CIK04_25915 [Vibrio sp. 03_296]|nr:hypothetical protein CIK04_25915 [Vibrio sp. 03_296]